MTNLERIEQLGYDEIHTLIHNREYCKKCKRSNKALGFSCSLDLALNWDCWEALINWLQAETEQNEE